MGGAGFKQHILRDEDAEAGLRYTIARESVEFLGTSGRSSCENLSRRKNLHPGHSETFAERQVEPILEHVRQMLEDAEERRRSGARDIEERFEREKEAARKSAVKWLVVGALAIPVVITATLVLARLALRALQLD